MKRTFLWKLATRTSRLVGAVILAAASVAALPRLTTIQDVLYKADGTKFNGLLIISWNSFEADDMSDIVSQSLTVKVVDGNFRVQLVPTTDSNPPTYYTVKYNSDGKIQFQETWVVGAASTPLRIRDVRASTSTTNPVQPPSQTPIQESDVVGLTGDLGLRPVKGPGFSPGRAASINDAGGIEAVVGNPSDCVLVDGTSGPCGVGSSATFVDGEVLTGIIDGANATFMLANQPNPAASLELFRNGVVQKPAVDYTLAGATVLFLAGAIPQPGDTLLAWYRLPGAAPIIGGQTAPGPEITCSAAGTSTSSSSFTSLGSCTIPAGVLQTGDRVEVHFDLGHSGTAAGFEFKVLWGGTVLVDRVAGAADALIAGKGESAVYNGGAQLRSESWGTALAYAATVANATDNIVPAMTIDFRVQMAQATSETVTLRNFTVVRYPAH